MFDYNNQHHLMILTGSGLVLIIIGLLLQLTNNDVSIILSMILMCIGSVWIISGMIRSIINYYNQTNYVPVLKQ